MAKKVLIVESSLAVRGIAESLLRQNGIEVFGADNMEFAKDIIDSSKVDLILVATEIVDSQGRKFYELLSSETATASIPLMLLHDPSLGDVSDFPPEMIVNKPFTPRNFLNAVAAFIGVGELEETPGEESPFGGGDLEDDIIDAALGLDKLEVDKSEVLNDDSGVIRLDKKKKTTDAMIGFEHDETAADTGKVNAKSIDQVRLSPEVNELNHDAAHDSGETPEFAGNKEGQEVQPQPDMTESSKLDIVTDQYGLAATPEQLQIEEPEDTGHDYDWFIKEMRKEAKSFEESAEADAGEPIVDDNEPLQFEQALEYLHPSAPAPASASMPPPSPPPQPQPQPQPEPEPSQPLSTAHHEAVDKFINEFRKEMEKFSEDEIPDVPVTNIAPDKKDAPAENLPWHETLEEVDAAELGLFSKQVADLVAEKVAQRIMGRLDQDIVFSVIRETIEEYIREKIAK